MLYQQSKDLKTIDAREMMVNHVMQSKYSGEQSPHISLRNNGVAVFTKEGLTGILNCHFIQKEIDTEI